MQIVDVPEVPQLWSAREAFMRQVESFQSIEILLIIAVSGWIQAIHVHPFCYSGFSHRAFDLDPYLGLYQNLWGCQEINSTREG